MTLADEQFIERLTRYVDDNISKSTLSSDTLAKEFYVSPRHFNRKVKSITGKDTTHFIRGRRVKKACELLTNTTLPVSEIFVKCGMESANYFSRIFKMEMGTTPTAYRNATQQ